MPCSEETGVHVFNTDLKILAYLCNNAQFHLGRNILLSKYNVISKPLAFLFIEMVICDCFFWHGLLVSRWTNYEFSQYLNLMPNSQISQKRGKGRVRGAYGNHGLVCYNVLKNIF